MAVRLAPEHLGGLEFCGGGGGKLLDGWIK